MRLYRSNLRKLIRRPATWVTFLLLDLLVALIFLAITAGANQTARQQESLASRVFVTFPGAFSSRSRPRFSVKKRLAKRPPAGMLSPVFAGIA